MESDLLLETTLLAECKGNLEFQALIHTRIVPYIGMITIALNDWDSAKVILNIFDVDA